MKVNPEFAAAELKAAVAAAIQDSIDNGLTLDQALDTIEAYMADIDVEGFHV